jgi:hypothetical protein
MDPLTVTTATFPLMQGVTTVSGAVTYAGVTATFTPAGNLAYNTTYTATITAGAEDLAGNSLASDYVQSFPLKAVSDTIQFPILSTMLLIGVTAIIIAIIFPSQRNLNHFLKVISKVYLIFISYN